MRWPMSILTKYSSAWASRLHLYRFWEEIGTNCPELIELSFSRSSPGFTATPWEQSRATPHSGTGHWVLSSIYCATNTAWCCKFSHRWPPVKAKTKTWHSSAGIQRSANTAKEFSVILSSSKSLASA